MSHSEKREGAVLPLVLASIHTLVETVCMAPCRRAARWAGSTGAGLRPLPGTLAMHEPERWPVSNAETWWSWRWPGLFALQGGVPGGAYQILSAHLNGAEWFEALSAQAGC